MRIEQVISDHWKLYGFKPEVYQRNKLIRGDYKDKKWISCKVPSDVHSILIENGRIEHPYYKQNDLKCAYVEKKIWIYQTEVELTEEMLGMDTLELTFYGVDTYATIIFNGQAIGEFANMFIEHTVDIKPYGKQGKNTLIIEFPVMSEKALEKKLPVGFWTNYSTERAYARKAAYSYGWDWAPRLATIGLWQPVVLKAVTKGKIFDVYMVTETISLEQKYARLQCQINSQVYQEGDYNYRITMIDQKNNRFLLESSQPDFSFELKDVLFWWCHDLGNPHLYQVIVELVEGEEIIDQYIFEYGVRSLKVRTKDEEGNSVFQMVLNGIPIMSRGANWVPVDSMLGSVSDNRYRKLIQMAKEGNMNTLSLWGGGIYEKDIFYQLCDQHGILVWQYFMFACGEYPDYDEEFMSNVQKEIKKAVVRLRNYSCIALWVGNVELTMLCQKIKLPRTMYGKRLFEEKIPEWLKTLDPKRYYVPSSPWGGQIANSMEEGDRHNWDVWFTDVPYTHYAADTTRFASEYGLHASPVKQTIEKYIKKKDPKVDDFDFKYLNKDQSLERMYYYMQQHIGNPQNVDEYVDYSMFVQAEGLQFGTEHYRRNFPMTAGALIWQLNDCVPSHSWSMIDYDLIPKASYYYGKRFFAPVHISLEQISQNETGIWILNNSRDSIEKELCIAVKDYLGNCFYEEQVKVQVQANSVKKIKELAVGGRFYPNVIIPNRHRLFYVVAWFSQEENKSMRFFGEYQETMLPKAQLKVTKEGARIRISTDYFARFCKIDGDINGLQLSDNYFNLEAGEEKIVCIKDSEGKERNRKLYVKALNSERTTI